VLKSILFIGVAAVAAAQQPSVSNAKLQTASASGGLQAAIQAATGGNAGPFWIGYTVPVIPGGGQSCCWSNDARGCGLEGQRGAVYGAPAGPVKLEGPTHFSVLLRIENRAVHKIRAFSVDCPLDAGGLTLQWLTDVRPAESVAVLERYALTQSPEKLSDGAIHALAIHARTEAEKSLERLAASQTDAHRRSAIFWLANSRGRRGFEVVSRVAREDPSEKVREHAAFALTQSKEPEAIPAIIRMAKEDASVRVRGQALFWLAQKASREASKAITDAIDRDPDTEVKKKAVFALSQLPKDEGVPLLIQVARTNGNPAVRKQAMFWLGQSRDPRALKFFEDVLSK
jgi:HEAT repeat protein